MGPREGRGEVANSDFVPFAGDPGECRGYVVIQPVCCPPREGSSEVANSDFVPFAWDPRECRGYVVIQPICAPPEKVGVR